MHQYQLWYVRCFVQDEPVNVVTKPVEAAPPPTTSPLSEFAEKLELLAGMGFPQQSLNEWCLRENDGNVQEAALQLVQLYNLNSMA